MSHRVFQVQEAEEFEAEMVIRTYLITSFHTIKVVMVEEL